MPNANPISGPWPVTGAPKYHPGPAKYQKIVTVTNGMLPFTATGSYASPIGISTNDNSGTVALLFPNNGGSTSLSDFSNNTIYELGIYQITGSLSGDKHVHLYYA